MSESVDDAIAVALRVAEALEAVGATYFVGGSCAAQAAVVSRGRGGV
jgi:hypothetical protein